MDKVIKVEMEHILKEIPEILKDNPCQICSLTVGRFNCLNRALCKCDAGFVWVIKNSKFIV